MRPLSPIPNLALLALLPSCAPEPPEPPLAPPPVDSMLVGSVDVVAGWEYRRGVVVDLDGDRRPERLVVAADVALDPDGQPRWGEGHRWAVYVEGGGGEPTLLYTAFIPQGYAEAAVLMPDAGGRSRVLVQERAPQWMRLHEVAYAGPNVAYSTWSARHDVREWLPGHAVLPTPLPPPTPEDTR